MEINYYPSRDRALRVTIVISGRSGSCDVQIYRERERRARVYYIRRYILVQYCKSRTCKYDFTISRRLQLRILIRVFD